MDTAQGIPPKGHTTEDRTTPPFAGPDDATHRAVHDTVKGLINDVVADPARKQLQDALNRPRADAPRTATHKAPDGGAFR